MPTKKSNVATDVPVFFRRLDNLVQIEVAIRKQLQNNLPASSVERFFRENTSETAFAHCLSL